MLQTTAPYPSLSFLTVNILLLSKQRSHHWYMTIKLLIKTNINRTLFGFHPFYIHAFLCSRNHITFSFPVSLVSSCLGQFFSLSFFITSTVLRNTGQVSRRMGFPGGSGGKEPNCQHRRRKRCRFDPWAGKLSDRRAWLPTPVFLPGESHGQRSLVGYSPRGGRVGHSWRDLEHMHIQENISQFVLIWCFSH